MIFSDSFTCVEGIVEGFASERGTLHTLHVLAVAALLAKVHISQAHSRGAVSSSTSSFVEENVCSSFSSFFSFSAEIEGGTRASEEGCGGSTGVGSPVATSRSVFGTPQMPHSAMSAELSVKEQMAHTHSAFEEASSKVAGVDCTGTGTAGCSGNIGEGTGGSGGEGVEVMDGASLDCEATSAYSLAGKHSSMGNEGADGETGGVAIGKSVAIDVREAEGEDD